MVLFLVIACNNDDADFMVQLNEPFLAVRGEKYTCITDDGDIIIEIKDIEDRRVRERDCDVVSDPGAAVLSIDISFNENKKSYQLNYLGCTITEGNPNDSSLPSIQLENDYTLRMFDILPYSPNMKFEDRVSLKDYEIKFIIIK